jgi:hypothetical protein
VTKRERKREISHMKEKCIRPNPSKSGRKRERAGEHWRVSSEVKEQKRVTLNMTARGLIGRKEQSFAPMYVGA